jgi:hypothetical protein
MYVYIYMYVYVYIIPFDTSSAGLIINFFTLTELFKAEKVLKESNTLNEQLILKPETSCPAGSNLLE